MIPIGWRKQQENSSKNLTFYVINFFCNISINIFFTLYENNLQVSIYIVGSPKDLSMDPDLKWI